MSVKTHAAILEIVPFAVVFFLLPVSVCIWVFTGKIVNFVIAYFGGIFGMIIITVLFALLMPLKCSNPACHGDIQREWIPNPNFGLDLRYKCTLCRTLSFSNFTLGGGGETPP